jgi:hypothetical protein
MWLGHDSCLLVGELVPLLHRLLFGPRLPSTRLLSLPLLMSTPSLNGEPVSGRGAATHGGIVIIVWVARQVSIHGVVLTRAGRAPMPRILGEGRPEPPSLLDVVWNSSVESSFMASHGDGDPLHPETPTLIEPIHYWKPPGRATRCPDPSCVGEGSGTGRQVVKSCLPMSIVMRKSEGVNFSRV